MFSAALTTSSVRARTRRKYSACPWSSSSSSPSLLMGGSAVGVTKLEGRLTRPLPVPPLVRRRCSPAPQSPPIAEQNGDEPRRLLDALVPLGLRAPEESTTKPSPVEDAGDGGCGAGGAEAVAAANARRGWRRSRSLADTDETPPLSTFRWLLLQRREAAVDGGVRLVGMLQLASPPAPLQDSSGPLAKAGYDAAPGPDPGLGRCDHERRWPAIPLTSDGSAAGVELKRPLPMLRSP
mmetsp:Transcript_27305/g.78125  ORF Transcript_27305/g.78125 Transcript_27305/m.78125 type:complete len:237 (+) Transcript_27305:1448-2158(+)